jgi:uncharacterized protein (TIGR03437 family)
MRPGILAVVSLVSFCGGSAFAQPTAAGAASPAGLGHGTAIAPGSLFSVFGTGLASGLSIADSVTLSTTLLDVDMVTIGGIAAPLVYVSDGQINAQAPWGLAAGPADVVVTRGGVASAPVSIQVNNFAPALYEFGAGALQAIAINTDGSVAAAAGAFPGITSHPAIAGDTLTFYATGLGAVGPAIADGTAPGDASRLTTLTPTVMVDGVAGTVMFSGLSPQFVGVYQLNVVIPPGTTTGKAVPVTLQIGGVTGADPATIALQ